MNIERLHFEKDLESHRLYLEEKIRNSENDRTMHLLYQTGMAELEYIWKLYEINFNGTYNKESLR